MGADVQLTRAISAEIVALYATVYGHDRTTATTYINDNVVVCVLENILSEHEDLPHRGRLKQRGDRWARRVSDRQRG